MLSFQYDQAGDILYINQCAPYAEQESEEIDYGVIARLNPVTNAVENLEILFFSKRSTDETLFEIPVLADLRLDIKLFRGKPMLNVTIDDIQRDPLKYLHQVEAGETLVIFRSDKPIAELRPIASGKQLRPFGLCAGEFTVPDDFDAPLPEDLLNAFEGK